MTAPPSQTRVVLLVLLIVVGVVFALRALHMPWLVLIPIVAFFLLKDSGAFRRTIVTALPHRIELRGH